MFGHLLRAHCGGNSSNSLSKDLDRVRRHWQGPCWVAVVVVDAEVWELKLPRSIMPLWEGCPAVDGLYGCCRCARARVRRAVPQCTACDKAALERLSLGSGCTSRLQGLPSPRGLGEWLARRIRRGAALLPGARAHKVVERVAPSRADDAVTAERDIAKRTSLSITTRNAAIRLDGARYNKLHIPLLCGHRHSPPAKRSH